MKRTYGKTKTRPRNRPINVIDQLGRVSAEKNCPTHRQALQEFFKTDLLPKGYSEPIIVGNVLTATSRGSFKAGPPIQRTYTAVDRPHAGC